MGPRITSTYTRWKTNCAAPFPMRPVGNYEGHDVSPDGSDGYFYLYGPDAEAIYRVISPVLAASSFMPGATVTLWFGPRKWRTPKRVIQLPG